MKIYYRGVERGSDSFHRRRHMLIADFLINKAGLEVVARPADMHNDSRWLQDVDGVVAFHAKYNVPAGSECWRAAHGFGKRVLLLFDRPIGQDNTDLIAPVRKMLTHASTDFSDPEERLLAVRHLSADPTGLVVAKAAIDQFLQGFEQPPPEIEASSKI